MKSFLSYINQLNSIESIGRYRLLTSLAKSRDIEINFGQKHSSNLYKLGGVSLLTAAGFLIAPTSAQAAPVNLQFSSPTCVSPIVTTTTTNSACLGVGSVWRFSNVISSGGDGTQRDALVTISSISAGTSVSNIDEDLNSGGSTVAKFQPIVTSPTTPNSNSYATFNIKFIAAGAPLSAPAVVIGGDIYETSFDVDGDGGTLREIVEFGNPSSTYLVTPNTATGLQLDTSPAAFNPPGVRYIAKTSFLASGISIDNLYKATALYPASTTNFNLTLGSKNGTSGCSGTACDRHTSVSFLVSDIVPINDLAVAKSHTGNFTVGLPATYAITASNIGAASSGNITIRDPLPTGLTIPDGAVTITGTNAVAWSCNASSNVITCTSSTSIPAQGSSTFNITGIAVGSAAVSPVSNTATITTGGGSVSTNDAATDVATVISKFSISGTVFNDANGGTIDGTGTNAGSTTLTAYLVSTAATPLTLAKVTVGSNGIYSFPSISAGNYTVRLSNDATGAIGSAPPAASLPTNYVNTGEGVGITPTAVDTTVDGSTAITVGTTNLTDVNFGIDRLPTTNSLSSPSQQNPGSTTTVLVPTLAGTDPEDGALGNGKSFRIVTVPNNGILYYPNASNVPVAVTAGQLISNYDSTKLTLDPDNGGLTVTFTYAAVDAAGQQGSIATVTRSFIGTPLGCNSMYGSYSDGTTFRSLRQYTPPTTSGSEIVRLTGSGNNKSIAAIAIDPILDSSGNRRVYYTENNTGSTYIYYYDNTGNFNTNTLLAVSSPTVNVIQDDLSVTGRTLTTTVNNTFNRMGFDPNGILYIMDGQNKLYRYTPDRTGNPVGTTATGTLSTAVTISDNPQNDSNRRGIAKLANSGGGDIAFDSQGRMFIVTYDGLAVTTPAADNPTEFRLFNISGASSSAPVANLLGVETNPGDTIAGIAFQGSDFKLYMQGSSGKSYNWNLALNDISTVSIANPGSADLGSCTYPVFNANTGFTKTVANITNPTARVLSAGDLLEYTLTVNNTGNFVATNAQVADPIPTGMTYVTGSTKLNGNVVTDVVVTPAAGSTPAIVAMPYATAKQVNSPGLFSGSVATGATNAAKVVFRVTVDATNTKVCNQADFSYDGAAASIPSVSDDPTTATVGDTTCTGVIKAGLVMVKRITGIKPAGGVLDNVNNPNDGTSLNSTTPVHNPADTNNNDTNAKWPNGYLKGAYDAGKIKPGDEIEYTVYYLNSKGASASNLKMCDPIRGNQAYVAGTMRVQVGGGTVTNLTDAIDTDQGNTYGAAALPALVPTPTDCNAANTSLSGSTDRGGISLGIAGAVPSATAAGTPSTSYGLFRFRTKVNP